MTNMRFHSAGRIIHAALLDGLLAALLAMSSACSRHSPLPPAPKPAVTVVTMHPAPVSLTTELPGRVSAYRVAEVRPQVNGVILKRLFTEGERVTEGQQLYQIDPGPYQASLSSAQASLARARAAVEVSKLTVQRYKTLVEEHAVSRQDYDNAAARPNHDEGDAAAAEAAVRTATINLAYTKVSSPISGRTGRSTSTEGALVTADQAFTLVTI